MYLMAMRPEPAYVLTSSNTIFSGSVNSTYNAYAMPVGYGAALYGTSAGTVSGTATTRYHYTDVRAAERLGNAIATAISQSRQRAYRQRGLEVVAEYDRRVARRRRAAQEIIYGFFDDNPDLLQRRTLVAAIAPWAAAEGLTDGRQILRRTKEIIDNLPRGEGWTGSWYGTFAQTSTTAQGETIAFSEFVRIKLRQEGTELHGKGMLGSGEIIELAGEFDGASLSAAVANTTSGINVELSAIGTPSQITGEFEGFGAGMRMTGTFTLLR